MEEEAKISAPMALTHLFNWMRDMVNERQLPTKIDNEGEPPSKMLKIEKPSSEEDENKHKKRVDAIMQCSQVLRHAANCHNNHCKQRGCLEFRTLLVHKNECNTECCFLCTILLAFSIVHTKKCLRDYNKYIRGSSPDCSSESNLPPDSYAQMEIPSIPETGLMSTLVHVDLNSECKVESSNVHKAKVKKDMIKGFLRHLLLQKRFAQKPEQYEQIKAQIGIIVLENSSLFPEYQDWMINIEAFLAKRRGGSLKNVVCLAADPIIEAN